VLGNLADRSFVCGIPAIDHRRWRRSQALFKKLPELRRELRELRERIAVIERRLAGED
jgi:UDP-3-O-[3-hydroxymyristoyl] glucosamine N-acyltransferase